MLFLRSNRLFPFALCLIVSFSLMACGKRTAKDEASAAALNVPTSLEGTWTGPCKALSGVNYYKEVLSFNLAAGTVTKSFPAFYDSSCSQALNQYSQPQPTSFSHDSSAKTIWMYENGAYWIYKYSFSAGGRLTMEQYKNLGLSRTQATGVVVTYTR